jgi:hypothetical protein
MKVNISASIDDTINTSLISYCEKQIGGDIYKRSKSEVVNDALREYFLNRGVL